MKSGLELSLRSPHLCRRPWAPPAPGHFDTSLDQLSLAGAGDWKMPRNAEGAAAMASWPPLKHAVQSVLERFKLLFREWLGLGRAAQRGRVLFLAKRDASKVCLWRPSQLLDSQRHSSRESWAV